MTLAKHWKVVVGKLALKTLQELTGLHRLIKRSEIEERECKNWRCDDDFGRDLLCNDVFCSDSLSSRTGNISIHFWNHRHGMRAESLSFFLSMMSFEKNAESVSKIEGFQDRTWLSSLDPQQPFIKWTKMYIANSVSYMTSQLIYYTLKQLTFFFCFLGAAFWVNDSSITTSSNSQPVLTPDSSA